VRKRDGEEARGVPRRPWKRSLYCAAAEDGGATCNVSLFPDKVPRPPRTIHDVTAGLLPNCLCVVSEAHSLGAQEALGTWRDQPWYLSPLRGAPPHAALRYGLGDPQPARGWQEGAAGARLQFPKHVRKTVKANTLADLPPHCLLRALPAHRLLAPGTHNPDIALACDGLARVREPHVSRGDARTGIADQLATALDLDTANRERW